MAWCVLARTAAPRPPPTGAGSWCNFQFSPHPRAARIRQQRPSPLPPPQQGRLPAGGRGRGRTNLWKTAEQSLHTDVWLSKGKSTSPSLQSSHTKPLAWHRCGGGEQVSAAPGGAGGHARCSPHPQGWEQGAAWPGLGAHLAVQLDVLGEERVGLGERAAQAACVCVQQVLDGVGLVALHKVLPVLELRAQRVSALTQPLPPHWPQLRPTSAWRLPLPQGPDPICRPDTPAAPLLYLVHRPHHSCRAACSSCPPHPRGTA